MFQVSPLTPSPFDSARFGLNVCRASYENTDEATVLRELIDSMADVAIYRMPSSNSACMDKLQRFGFEVIHAGTLVYYTLDLRDYEPRPLRNTDLDITLAEAADDVELASLARTSFDGYVSHYSANPLFAPEKVLAGYCEWTLRHRLETDRTITWVARRGGRIIAYACCEFDAESKICDGGIYGVLPEEASRGLFGDLIRFTQGYFRDLGFVEMRMSTKVGNFAVQKVWIREGYHLYEAYDTFHVNALLSLHHDASQRRPIRFSPERLMDFQPHADDERACPPASADNLDPVAISTPRSALLLDPELSEMLRARFPAAGTTVMKASQLFLRPLRHAQDYSLSVDFPSAPTEDYPQAVARVWDDRDRLCVLSYIQLRTLHRAGSAKEGQETSC